MKNEDIEVLDDFQTNQAPNSNNNPNMNGTVESPNNASFQNGFNQNGFQNVGYNQSNDFNNVNQSNNYPNDFNNSFMNDANNAMQPNNGQDLTITAVYPNGFAVEENEELENTRVIKPKKSSSMDLYLVIIVAVLAITLVVLLVML